MSSTDSPANISADAPANGSNSDASNESTNESTNELKNGSSKANAHAKHAKRVTHVKSDAQCRADGLAPAARKISAVLSDIDGTLVRPDKSLSPATREAVRALARAGIPFSLASARPPKGLRNFVDALALSAPLSAYNGGNIVMPDMRVLDRHPIAPDDAQRAIDMLKERDIGAWVFTRGEWQILDPDGDYVDLEQSTIGYPPTVVEHYDLSAVDKILAACADTEKLARAEKEIAQAFEHVLTVGRSQAYYLDITHPSANKGEAAKAIAAHLGIPIGELAVLGDMSNDLPMFKHAGLAIAMGQASDEVKSHAHAVTSSNADDGVAAAIYELILPRAGRPSANGKD